MIIEQIPHKCPNCNGSGQKSTKICHSCNGRGIIFCSRTIISPKIEKSKKSPLKQPWKKNYYSLYKG